MAAKKKAVARTRAPREDKGVLDIADKSVLSTFEPSHGPNMDDRSDVVAEAPASPGDEGKEPGRG